MKTKLLSMAALTGIFLFAACSQENPAVGDEENNAPSEITLLLNSGGDGLTRAGRPVNSSAAANQVDRVQLKLYQSDDGATGWTVVSDAFDNNGIVQWTVGPTDEGTPGQSSHEAQQKLKVKNLLASRHYKVVAYGYKGMGTGGNNCAYTLTDNTGEFTTTALADEGANGANIEEIFAGNQTFQTNAEKKITSAVKVSMNRMVAGLLGYFKNIPVKKPHPQTMVLTPIQYVRVYTVAKTTQFKFPSTVDFNGAGTQTTAKTLLLEYNVKTIVDGNATGKYDEQVAAATSGTETFAIDAKTGSVVTVPNSILAGRFVIPFVSAVTDQNTLSVELLAADGSTVLKTWDVKVNTSNGGAETGLVDAYKYDIKRNHFYSIGKKMKSDRIKDPNIPDTDPDEDKAIDLNQDNDIILTLHDSWDVVYDMGLSD